MTKVQVPVRTPVPHSEIRISSGAKFNTYNVITVTRSQNQAEVIPMATMSATQPSGVHQHCVASRDIEQVLTDLDNAMSRVAKPQDRPLV